MRIERLFLRGTHRHDGKQRSKQESDSILHRMNNILREICAGAEDGPDRLKWGGEGARSGIVGIDAASRIATSRASKNTGFVNDSLPKLSSDPPAMEITVVCDVLVEPRRVRLGVATLLTPEVDGWL
jgi:hypothetical protein